MPTFSNPLSKDLQEAIAKRSDNDLCKSVDDYLRLTKEAAALAFTTTDYLKVFDRTEWVSFLRSQGIQKRSEIFLYRGRWKKLVKKYDKEFKESLNRSKLSGRSSAQLWALEYRWLEDSYREGPRGRFIGRKSCLQWMIRLSLDTPYANGILR